LAPIDNFGRLKYLLPLLTYLVNTVLLKTYQLLLYSPIFNYRSPDIF